MSGGPTYILHEMFSPLPLTNISSVIHMCPNKNWPQPQHSDRNAVGKCDQSQFSKKIQMILFVLCDYVIFRCFYLPVFSSFLLYQELQGHLPFFTRFLPDNTKTRWLPILSKKLFLLKSFIFHQQAVLEWPNLLAEQVSLIKSSCFFVCLRS